MDYKKYLRIGMVLGAIGIGNSYAENSKQNLEIKVVQNVKQIENNSTNTEPNSIEYNHLKEVIVKEFLNDYLKKVTPKSSNFKKLREKYGEQGVLERYCSAHGLCLDLAYNNLDKEINSEQYTELGKRLAEKQNETSKGLSRVNYLDKGVVKAFENWGKLKTQNFKNLLKAKVNNFSNQSSKEEYAAKMHRTAYNQKQYSEYVKQQNKANDELYSAMKKTLNFIEATIGGGEIETIAQLTREAYETPLKEYFKDENKK